MNNQSTKEVLLKIPLLKHLILVLDTISLPWLNGLSFYELIEFYINGVLKGGVTERAGAVAYSFFMALFPFALFILNLIPYIPIKGFQTDFLLFVKDNVPPTTYDAIESIIKDILNNSQTGLLSWGVFLSIILMTNGVNAIMSSFENSLHISIKRAYFRQYFVALLLSLALTFILIITVVAIVFLEIVIQRTTIQEVLTSQISDKISLLQLGRYVFVVLMIMLATALLFKYGIKQSKKKRLITIGTLFTTVLIVLTSYFFGIWVVKFSKYNELYGSIGTLLVFLFYLWINCMILLLGFELDASIRKLKKNE